MRRVLQCARFGRTTAILISGNKLVFINNTSANPTITVVER